MNILIVNDDGIQSEGLQVLAKRLSEEHKVYVLAPDSNRSAVSHHYSVFNSNTKPVKYQAMADFAVKNLETLIKLSNVSNPRIFINVNAASLDSYKGVKFCDELCVRIYKDKINVTQEDGALKSHIVPGHGVDEYSSTCDYSIIRQGYVCVSRIYADPVCTDVLEGLSFKL